MDLAAVMLVACDCEDESREDRCAEEEATEKEGRDGEVAAEEADDDANEDWRSSRVEEGARGASTRCSSRCRRLLRL